METHDGVMPAEFLLAAAARRFPAEPALVCPAAGAGDDAVPRAVTYAELERLTRDAAGRLLSRGLRPGDRVAVRLPPTIDYPVLLFALVRAGLVAVPLSTRLPEAALPGLLEMVGCRHLIAAGGTDGPWPASIPVLATGGILGDGPPAAATAPFDSAGDATIVFTSGSSGRPKAALHTYANHWHSAAGSNRNIPVGPGDRWLLSLPLWHVGGISILFRAFLGGGAVAVPAPGAPLAGAITALAATHVSLVATQLARLLRDPAGAAALARLKAVLLGGGALPPALVEESVRRGIPIFSSYGSTELSSQVTATRPGDPVGRLLGAGRALPFREVAVAPGGEILARGATLFRGYWTAAGLDPARDAAGWFHSGDLGSVDAEGYLSVTGRRDSMFISGGENIHPEQIERELCRHPGVLEAAVVPVESAEFGARPVAFVRMAAGTLPAAQELAAHLRRTLPGFMVPDRFHPWPAAEEGMKPPRQELTRLAAALQRGPEARG
jgi:O-succinylbenzoic acid--CoA ligase